MKINKRKLIQFALALVITIAIFIVLFRKIPLSRVLYCIEVANFKIILLAVLISFVNNILVTAGRWKFILERLGYFITWKEAILIKMGSDPLISILPLRSGELSRIAYLKGVRNIPYSMATLSIISEYLLNISSRLFFIFLGLIYRWGINNNFNLEGISIFVGGFLSIPTWVSKKLTLPFHYAGLKAILCTPGVFILTFLMGLGELTIVCLLSSAIGISLPLYAVLIFTPVIILVSSLPISIFGLGIRESLLIFFFSKFASFDVLFSLGIIYSFTEHIFPAALGAVFTGLFLKRIVSNNEI